MTAYFTAVSNELLAEIRADKCMFPAGFRLKREVGPILPSGPVLSRDSVMTMVEFEDDDASIELAGRVVEPTFQSHYDGGGKLTHTTIIARNVDTWPWRVAA